MISYRLSPLLLWALLSGQFVALIPHLSILPLWIYFIFGVGAFWRLMVAYGYWSLPHKRTVYSVAILSLFITFLTLGWSRDAALTLLALTFSLKLLELKALRDSMIIIFLGFFLLAVYCLYSDSIIATIYIFAAFIVLTTVLIGLNRIGEILPIRSVLQKTLMLLLLAIPLAVASFIFFPRIEIHSWSVTNLSGKGISGFSSTLETGQVSQLAQSDKVVFRAMFNKFKPLQKKLYWRGLVLSDFDGKRWKAATRLPPLSQKGRAEGAFLPPDKTTLSYEVFLEPTRQIWLFVIEKLAFATGEVIEVAEERLEAKSPVRKKLNYHATSVLSHEEAFKFDDLLAHLFEKGPAPENPLIRGGISGNKDGGERIQSLTTVPLRENPKSRELAEKLFARANANPTQYIALVLNHFRRHTYTYTLNPPRLPANNPIDDFLLNSKKGFCEHYATAFTFLMRVAQIPARVVVGYQGGEYNPYTNFWTVREYHAHAWSEVWLPNKGWVRVDPTEAVAPQRIELGVDENTKAEISKKTRSFLMVWLGRNLAKPYFAELRLRMEAVDTIWQSVVVDYSGLLSGFLLGSFSWAPFVVVLAFLMGMVFFFLSATFLFKRVAVQPQDPVLKAYHLFCKKLAKIGIIRRKEEGPKDFMDRVICARPDLKGSAGKINELYIHLQYAGLGSNKQAIKDFCRKVRQFNF